MRGYASSYNIISILTHRMNSDTHKRITALGLLVTIGIVFGDIGTSPLYVMRAVIGATPNFDADYIIGAVSCVIWTLTLQTTLKYVIIALRADNNGEGGILSLLRYYAKCRADGYISLQPPAQPLLSPTGSSLRPSLSPQPSKDSTSSSATTSRRSRLYWL